MQKQITSKVMNSADVRRALGAKSFFGFLLSYFPQLFRFDIAEFHERWYELLEFFDPETETFFTYLVLVAFRDSAKTTLAKIKILRDICYKRKKLISYVCYEKEKSGEALFDIATWLQTNKLILHDFGDLFKSAQFDESKPEKKTISNFVTSNGVRVTAFSIRQSVRGRVFDLERPDCYVIDDFENSITKKSAVMTRKAIDFMKELMTGIAAGAEVLFICNRISDTGSVQWLLDTGHNNPDFRIQDVPLIFGGQSTWPAKFVMTDIEAREINMNVQDPSKFVISIESKRRTANADGSKTFEQEYLNQPQVDGDRFFDTEKVDARIEVLKNIEWQDKDPLKPNYKKVEGDWVRFGQFDKNHINAVAADISEGFGNDSSVIECFDFTTGKQVAEFESNMCEPALIGKYMVEEGKKGGWCVLIPERNSIGNTTVKAIKDLDYVNIYREKSIDKITNKPVHKFGWNTNSKTKPLMLFDFKRDFEAGLIEINSMALLREMRAFSNTNIMHKAFDPEASNHFDRVMAAAIAWQGRNIKQIKGFVI